MTNEKKEKLIIAITVATTVLFVFLLFVLVFQWVSMAQQNKRINKLEAEQAYWQEQVDKNTIDVAWFEGHGKAVLAIKKGWIFKSGRIK